MTRSWLEWKNNGGLPPLKSDYEQTIDELKIELEKLRAELEVSRSELRAARELYAIDIGIELLYATKEAEKLKQLVGTILLECLVYSGTPEFDKIVRLIKETVLAK